VPAARILTAMAGADDTRELRQARDHLRDACSALLAPQTAELVRDGGSVTRHVGPSLMAQLRAAVATGGEVTRGPRGTSRPLPIAPDVHDLLAALESDVALWPWADRGTTEERITGTVNALCRTTNLDAITTVDRHLTAWCADIRRLLDPRRRLHLAAPCPACGHRMATTRDPDTGEPVQVHALQVGPAPDTGELQCTCLRCGALWDTHHLALLAGALE
jgi:hypothetical protein